MGASYRSFCPVAKAMELLDERWTLLVVREALAGSQHFNDLRRGLPRMSPSLLSKRLQQLVRSGVMVREQERYVLTDAGLELRPVVEALGAWGVRWIGEIGDAELDPKLLLWDMHRNVDHGALPVGRTVISFRFPGAASGHWWLVLTGSESDVCDVDPGFEPTVRVTADLRALTEVWMGDLTWPEAQRTGGVQLQGPQAVCRDVPRWFTLNRLAGVPRPDAPSLRASMV